MRAAISSPRPKGAPGTAIAMQAAGRHGRPAATEMTMRISRREFGALTGAALVFRAAHAKAADADIFVPGQNLPANLDPHQILDVGATGYALNGYDNLYRYEDNPPKMQPWLAESHTVSPNGLIWDLNLRPGVKF